MNAFRVSPRWAAVWALMSAGLALSLAFAAANRIHRLVSRGSHEQPAADSWIDDSVEPSPALVATGRKLFLNNCAHCHGIDALGDEGPDLHDVEASDRYILNTIARGIPHEMPAFGKKLTRAEIAPLIAYIRSLEKSG